MGWLVIVILFGYLIFELLIIPRTMENKIREKYEGNKKPNNQKE